MRVCLLAYVLICLLACLPGRLDVWLRVCLFVRKVVCLLVFSAIMCLLVGWMVGVCVSVGVVDCLFASFVVSLFVC